MDYVRVESEEVRLRKILQAFGIRFDIKPEEVDAVVLYRIYLKEELNQARKRRDEVVAMSDYPMNNAAVSWAQSKKRQISLLEQYIAELDVEYRRMFQGWEEALVKALEWLEHKTRRPE